ncbi:hypothetical protein ACIBQ1_40280 [Nonomuraea sp. NPDC050153]
MSTRQTLVIEAYELIGEVAFPLATTVIRERGVARSSALCGSPPLDPV